MCPFNKVRNRQNALRNLLISNQLDNADSQFYWAGLMNILIINILQITKHESRLDSLRARDFILPTELLIFVSYY